MDGDVYYAVWCGAHVAAVSAYPGKVGQMGYMMRGISQNPDGSFSIGRCRAKPENRGRFGCNHFEHAATMDEAKKLQVFYESHKDEFKGIDFNHDLHSYTDSLRTYLVQEMDVDPMRLRSQNVSDWFPDVDERVRMLGEAMDSGVFDEAKASQEFTGDVQKLVDSGVKVEVCSDRLNGMRGDRATGDTTIWCGVNGIEGNDEIEGEAHVLIMTANPDDELPTSRRMQRTYVPTIATTGPDERAELETLGYVSQRGADLNVEAMD